MKQKKSKQNPRILVLEPDEQLAEAIINVVKEAIPDALIEMTRSLEQAQQLVLGVKPELFILDVDGIPDLGQDFLYDLRTSHPAARTVVLTGVHLPEQREQATGLGAIHFLEKPVAHWDFVDLIRHLMRPSPEATAQKFEGTLRDLQFTDIIQLKCMSGATSVVEFTGPNGEKARVYFENGQVRHATAPGRQGMEAFNEIIRWKGGMVAEAIDAPATPQTISMDWQQLLMEAVRNADEMGAGGPVKKSRKKKGNPKILVVDDSLMLLSFVKEVLIDANYDVFSASSGDEAVREAQSTLPDLMLLDFILPDMRGDEVCRRLLENSGTAGIPVVYMSGYGAELQASRSENSNVIGFLNKPFTSDLLIKTVETHMPRKSEGPESTTPKPAEPQPEPSPLAAFPVEQEPAYREISEVGPELPQSESPQPAEIPWWTAAPSSDAPATAMPSAFEPAAEQSYAPDESLTAGLYFCGDTRFFGINRALQIIAHNKLTGTLRFFWEKQPVDLLTREGAVLFATTNDPDLYCSETPVALSSVDAERVAAARARQQETGCPLFLILSQDDLISHDAAFQLAQQHGQKVFAELWAAQCVRFSFHNNSLADFAGAVSEQTDVDQFALATLRMVQFPQLGERAYYDPASVPAYTRDGFERIQQLRLTVAEAQFASQFNGMRSVQQIAKNLRLDLKLASVTLFRFLALEVVECWPANAGSTQESKGLFKKLGSAIGLGE